MQMTYLGFYEINKNNVTEIYPKHLAKLISKNCNKSETYFKLCTYKKINSAVISHVKIFISI